jgi:membrane-associated phospholipid phosphatase
MGLAIIFAFFDLKISIQFVNAEMSWALFVRKFGEIPGLAMVIIAMFIMNTLRGKKRNVKSILLLVILLLLTALTFYYIAVLLVYHLTGSGDFFVKFGIQLWIVFGLVAILIQVILFRIKPRISERLHIFARITFWSAILNYVLFVQIGKALWGRVRFFDLDALYSDFTPWYLPQGVNGHASFPSGHAAIGWLLLPLIYLTFSKSWRVKLLIGALAVSWGLFVSIGRVKIGAHYASDVLFPTGVAILCFVFLYKHYHYPKGPEEQS